MTPTTSGSPSIANRWLNGSATVLWIGDSIGQAFENRLFQALRVTPAGIGMRGSSFGSISSTTWHTGGPGGLGAAGLLTERNYSPFPTRESVFNGTAVPVAGFPIALAARFASDTTESLLLASRNTLTFGGVDWLAGQPSLRLRAILYRNAASSSAIGRAEVRGSASTSTLKGAGPYLTLASATPGYLADEFPVIAPAVGEDCIVECQSFEGATPTASTNFILCCAILSTTKPGLTVIPANSGGWDVLRWLDNTIISDNALAGVLPLLNLTDIVISLGQNNPGAQTAAQFQVSLLQLVDRLRIAAPGASIIFLPTYDTNNPSTNNAPHLAGFADAHYAAQQLTPNSAFLNLFSAAGTFAQNNALSFYADGVHPTEPGKLYFLQTLQSLLDALLADARTTAAGRYAAQRDIEDAFGRDNVLTWSRSDASATDADISRIQRALDHADAAIDDFFRDGPYAVPLQIPNPTLARWSATLAGIALYRSRPNISTGSSTSASLTLGGALSLTASTNASSSTDPFSTRLADVRAEMAHYKSGVLRLQSSPALPTLAEAPSILS